MAAGIGSRYGGGIKQLEQVGPSGEIIMDYSIYDALEAGFNKVVFIIRKDLEKDFKEIIGNRIEKHVRVEYVYQELDALPEGFVKPTDRTKPWGTGHAVLCCKDIVKEPFAVINADDYYGKEGFKKIYDYLNSNRQAPGDYCMAGFILGNTLSENGAVTRGICQIGENGKLTEITETFGIEPKGDHAVAKDDSGAEVKIELNSPVSMNMWGFKPDLFDKLQEGFVEFLTRLSDQEHKKEYLLPEFIGQLVKKGEVTVQVLKTADRWFGVTYKEDKDMVVKSVRALVDQGVYPVRLFS
jgi:hypothetical protein